MLTARNAYYIKLGKAEWGWTADSIATGKARIGWRKVPIETIETGDWSAIRALRGYKTPGAASSDTNALRMYCESTDADLWITFHDSRLWWGRLQGPVRQDGMSKYREVAGGWRCTTLTDAPLLANQIPGSIARVQAFRGTICQVKAKDVLLHVLAGQSSPARRALEDARGLLVERVALALRNLHWKDFEILVDLVFQQSGWRRTSLLGETMKSVDLELEDPIAGDRYQVQVKSQADLKTAEACRPNDGNAAFRRFYFVVHSPSADLASAALDDDRFEVILPERLAAMVVDTGLTRWLLDRIA